jgi:uncharacterized membrane protein YkoI
MNYKNMQIKTIIFSICGASIVLFITAYNSLKTESKSTSNFLEVPEIVEAAFKKKYSDIPRVWQKHYYGYEAFFTLNNTKYEAEFSDTGEWLETEYYVTAKEFPEAVLNRIRQEYPNFKITKYEIEITSQEKLYEVDITDGEIEYEISFDADGKVKLDAYED